MRVFVPICPYLKWLESFYCFDAFMCYNIKKLQKIFKCDIVRIMKDKKDKTIKSPAWTKQPRDRFGHFCALDGSKPGKRIYTQADLDREIAQAFLSGTKQSREVVEIVKPNYEERKRCFFAGMNASKSGIFTPTQQFDQWAKSEGL